MKLHCFTGFWTTRRTPAAEEEEEVASSWFFSGADTVKIVPPKRAERSDAPSTSTDQHRSFFRRLAVLSSADQWPVGLPVVPQMADPVTGAPGTEPKPPAPGSPNVGKRQRRQGVYERDALYSEPEEVALKSVRQLRDEYLAMLVKAGKEPEEADGFKRHLAPPQSDYFSSGASDDDSWHRKHKVTRCGSSDSAMGPSDEETKDCPPVQYSAASTLAQSSVPSKIIIEAHTVVFPLDRKSSMDYASEETDCESRRQSCFTDDGEDVSRYRCWRTPSVVVSDYSDDIMGLTLEDVEYIRSRRDDPSSSPESSLHSSCSNLNYCGSTISGLESDYVLSKPYRKSSNCSTCSTLSGDEDQDGAGEAPPSGDSLRPTQKWRESSGWRKLRNIVQWTPFFQTYKKHRYPWVQLAGHQGNFKAGPDQGTILKKLCVKEEKCFQVLMKDVLRPYVPEYKGLVASDDGECEYIQLQDLLGDFVSPCVMDCKIGVRTYLEEELAKAKEKPKLRKDMYEKMCQIDESAPTDEEHKLKGVTKPRYMVWRETISSTATLGFRIEGIRNSDGTSSKDFKTTKSKEQIMAAFQSFTEGFPHVVPKYIQRLKAIKATLGQSTFFETHEVIGSSLLFVHDRYNANVWLIDFAKTIHLPADVTISHNSKWKVGNHEDGYLIGINNLIKIFMAVLENQPICVSPPLNLEEPPIAPTPKEKLENT
ncbi:inositol-trisphosphate 3-kinase B isoform X2 [Dendroctonus ponderosae]|uniref:inositol-trisphosphate 3-kinase B isoform X2 n=1 Tax=Dendroctonus ponderosae TaxID=77166 RepID=UPI0020360415|nr:inositol-trisphosphate 3-kinase B isoform X2 [Dendroctonus ponderosae]